MNTIDDEEEPSRVSRACLKKEKRGSEEEMSVDRSSKVVVVVDANSIVSEAILIF